MPTWACPLCGRRVPERAPACHCGTKREEADRVRPEVPPSASGEGRRWGVALVAAACILVGFVLREITLPAPSPARSQEVAPRAGASRPERSSRPDRARTGSQEPSPIAPEPREPDPEPSPERVVEIPAWSEADDPPPEESDTSLPELEPEPVSEVDQRRQLGEATLATTLDRLGRELERIEAELETYEGQCLVDGRAVGAPGCLSQLQAVRRRFSQLSENLGDAEREARRAWLEPGLVRERRATAGIDDRRLDSIRRRLADYGG